MQSNPNQEKYFDLHTTGLGYINRFRQVKPKKGKPYFAVTFAMLRGNQDDAQYTYIDCSIVGDAALATLMSHIEPDSDLGNDKYLAQVRIGDIYAEPFIYARGKKEGQPGVSIKGRLLKIISLRKNNEIIYQNFPAFVQIPANDPAFQTKAADLESRGYVWNDDFQRFERNKAS